MKHRNSADLQLHCLVQLRREHHLRQMRGLERLADALRAFNAGDETQCYLMLLRVMEKGDQVRDALYKLQSFRAELAVLDGMPLGTYIMLAGVE